MATTKPWANGPYPLIETPSKTSPLTTSHFSVHIASEMAHAHNSMLRALNSIHHQAPHITSPTDIRDFLFYCNAWYELVSHHHDAEESILFPAVERIANKPGLMAQNVEQHEAFHPGFFAFRDYVRGTRVEAYDGRVLVGILEGFAGILGVHLTEEIDTLLELKGCDEGELRKAWAELEVKMLDADKYTLYPMVMGTIDYDYEDGIHRGLFPPFPFFVPYLINYWYGRAHAGAWRFGPCDGFGKPRPLLFWE